MAKPPTSPPSSDIGGVNRDARVNVPSPDPDTKDAERVEEANDLARARPPSDSGTGGTGD